MKDLSDMEIRLATEADLPTIDEPVPLGGCGVVLPGRDYSGCEAERSGLRRADAADHDVVRKAGERLALVSYASTRQLDARPLAGYVNARWTAFPAGIGSPKNCVLPPSITTRGRSGLTGKAPNAAATGTTTAAAAAATAADILFTTRLSSPVRQIKTKPSQRERPACSQAGRRRRTVHTFPWRATGVRPCRTASAALSRA